jgi:chaperonin GroES
MPSKQKAKAKAKAQPKSTASAGRPSGDRPAAGAPGGRKMINVKPLRDRVLVRRLEEAEEKVGGIIIPDTAKEKPQQAEVMAVGSGRVLDNGTRVPLSVKAGDKVLLGKWSGTDVKIDDTEYLILKEDEILGVIG